MEEVVMVKKKNQPKNAKLNQTKNNSTKAAKAKTQKAKPAKQSKVKTRSSFETLGEFVAEVVEEQFERIVKQEKHVLADKDPEALHQMRVGTRRLRTALQVFEAAIKLPKAGSAKKLRDLARVLGAVRDLDVQTASLAENYHPNLNDREQKQLKAVAKSLKRQRVDALEAMKAALTSKQYQKLKTTYQTWLEQPQLMDIAQLPIATVLPDLLSPLLSELLLHPGWLISSEQELSVEQSEVLHDLRKVCKHVRYQTEFFTPLYGEEFQSWVKEIKQIQDDLGAFQDTQVLIDLLTQELGNQLEMPGLNALIRQERSAALANWEEVRQKYLDSGFRYHLHQMLLQPSNRDLKVHPELIEQHSIETNASN
jgi:CHAD domain-containing protein